MSHKIVPALFFAVLLALGGCGTFGDSEKAKAIDGTLTAYGEAVRWGYFETAYEYLPPKKRKEFPAYLKNIRVTGYDVEKGPVMIEKDEAVQLVRIEYVHDDVQLVRVLKDRQRWRWDKDAKGWWLDSGLPDFE